MQKYCMAMAAPLRHQGIEVMNSPCQALSWRDVTATFEIVFQVALLESPLLYNMTSTTLVLAVCC